MSKTSDRRHSGPPRRMAMRTTARTFALLTWCCYGLACGFLPQASAAGEEMHADWLVNRRGIEALDDDFVAPPFTPVSVANDGRVDVWGRQYQLDAYGLVKQATILGTPLFEKPMEFAVQLSGKTVAFRAAPGLIGKNARGRAEWISRANSARLDLEVQTTIEYDGMVRVDFGLVPHGRVELTAFRYRIHYPRATARFLHYIGARSTPESQNLPKNSYSRAVPEGQGTVWQAPFKTLVWLGDYERGFLWFCGSEEHWSPQPREQRPAALSIRRERDDVVLEIAPVTRPYVLERPARYTFGMFATPVRPMTKGWRGWTCNYRGLAEAAERANPGLEVQLTYLSGMHQAPFYEVVKDPVAYRRAADALHARGRVVLQYFDPAGMALGQLKNPALATPWNWQLPDVEFDQTGVTAQSDFAWKPPEFRYVNEWKAEPTGILGYSKEEGYRQYTVGIASGFADWFCYQVEQHARAGCDGAIDVDEWYPTPDMNSRHGMGYVDQDGVRRGEYDWWAKRDLMKRMCEVFAKARGRPPIMIAHTAAMLSVPCASLCDGILTGENFNTGYFRNDAYFDKYFQNKAELQECLRRGGEYWYYYAAPRDRWAVECLGKQFGFAVLTMPNLTKSKDIRGDVARSERATRDMLAMAVVHDNLVWPIFCNPQPVIRLWKARQKFGIADDGVEFLPYWGPRHLAETSADDIVISSYLKRAQCLINVANLGLAPRTFRVTINQPLLGSRRIDKLCDAESGKELLLADGAVKLSLSARDYTIILADLKGP